MNFAVLFAVHADTANVRSIQTFFIDDRYLRPLFLKFRPLKQAPLSIRYMEKALIMVNGLTSMRLDDDTYQSLKNNC